MSWWDPKPGVFNERDLSWAIEHLSHSKNLDELLDPNPCMKGLCPNWYIWR